MNFMIMLYSETPTLSGIHMQKCPVLKLLCIFVLEVTTSDTHLGTNIIENVGTNPSLTLSKCKSKLLAEMKAVLSCSPTSPSAKRSRKPATKTGPASHPSTVKTIQHRLSQNTTRSKSSSNGDQKALQTTTTNSCQGPGTTSTANQNLQPSTNSQANQRDIRTVRLVALLPVVDEDWKPFVRITVNNKKQVEVTPVEIKGGTGRLHETYMNFSVYSISSSKKESILSKTNSKPTKAKDQV